MSQRSRIAATSGSSRRPVPASPPRRGCPALVALAARSILVVPQGTWHDRNGDWSPQIMPTSSITSITSWLAASIESTRWPASCSARGSRHVAADRTRAAVSTSTPPRHMAWEESSLHSAIDDRAQTRWRPGGPLDHRQIRHQADRLRAPSVGVSARPSADTIVDVRSRLVRARSAPSREPDARRVLPAAAAGARARGMDLGMAGLTTRSQRGLGESLRATRAPLGRDWGCLAHSACPTVRHRRSARRPPAGADAAAFRPRVR